MMYSHNIESASENLQNPDRAIHQLPKSLIKIHTELSPTFMRVAEMFLVGRSVIIDHGTFFYLMEGKSSLLPFSNNFLVKVLSESGKLDLSPSFVVDDIVILDLQQASGLWVLSETLAMYACYTGVPLESLIQSKLPFGIRVAELDDSETLSTAATMQSAVLQSLCGSSKVLLNTDKETLTKEATSHNDVINLFSFAWNKNAIVVADDLHFLTKFGHAIEAAGFETLQYITVLTSSKTSPPPSLPATSPARKTGRWHKSEAEADQGTQFIKKKKLVAKMREAFRSLATPVRSPAAESTIPQASALPLMSKDRGSTSRTKYATSSDLLPRPATSPQSCLAPNSHLIRDDRNQAGPGPSPLLSTKYTDWSSLLRADNDPASGFSNAQQQWRMKKLQPLDIHSPVLARPPFSGTGSFLGTDESETSSIYSPVKPFHSKKPSSRTPSSPWPLRTLGSSIQPPLPSPRSLEPSSSSSRQGVQRQILPPPSPPAYISMLSLTQAARTSESNESESEPEPEPRKDIRRATLRYKLPSLDFHESLHLPSLDPYAHVEPESPILLSSSHLQHHSHQPQDDAMTSNRPTNPDHSTAIVKMNSPFTKYKAESPARPVSEISYNPSITSLHSDAEPSSHTTFTFTSTPTSSSSPYSDTLTDIHTNFSSPHSDILTDTHASTPDFPDFDRLRHEEEQEAMRAGVCEFSSDWTIDTISFHPSDAHPSSASPFSGSGTGSGSGTTTTTTAHHAMLRIPTQSRRGRTRTRAQLVSDIGVAI